ncbi:MAG: tyrosine-type recombinase/integrase [Xanthobacteraceae bacterium]
MTPDMPRPRPPHLHRETTRHGRTVWYVRVGHGPRIRINHDFGTPEFNQAYQAAVAGDAAPVTSKLGAGTLAWLIERYRESRAWLELSDATRYQREPILRQIISSAGKEPITRITRKAIVAGIERRSETPYQARHFRDVMRNLFQWALEAELVSEDPTIGVKLPRAPKAQRDRGFPAWTDDDVAAFEKRWPLGSRERVAFDVLRYTGLRREDAAQLGRQHVREGVIRLRPQKTPDVIVVIRVPPALAESIEAGPTGDMTFICTTRGRPYTTESFGNLIAEAARACGIRKSAHGLRKYAATKMAEAGATIPELEACFGWTGGRMASHYTRSADRERLGLSGSAKLGRTNNVHSIPAPAQKVRE